MEHCNRLAQEKSPYLLQHAHNPVNWFPWGGEAFEKARREEKPVFLSIGYCHDAGAETVFRRDVSAEIPPVWHGGNDGAAAAHCKALENGPPGAGAVGGRDSKSTVGAGRRGAGRGI